MDKVQVSRAVAGLVRKKRVQKQSDDTDGRITRLQLTARGRAIYDEIVPSALDLEAQFLAALAPKERVALDVMLAKLSVEAHLLTGPGLEGGGERSIGRARSGKW